jgi:hypothetical protein
MWGVGPNTSVSACTEHVLRAREMGLCVETRREEGDRHFVCLSVTPSLV